MNPRDQADSQRVGFAASLRVSEIGAVSVDNPRMNVSYAGVQINPLSAETMLTLQPGEGVKLEIPQRLRVGYTSALRSNFGDAEDDGGVALAQLTGGTGLRLIADGVGIFGYDFLGSGLLKFSDSTGENKGRAMEVATVSFESTLYAKNIADIPVAASVSYGIERRPETENQPERNYSAVSATVGVSLPLD